MLLNVLRSLRRDDRGDAIVEFVLVLPIFILMLFGSYEVWKLVHLKQSLEDATIQAARYLSVEGLYLMDEPPGYPSSWQQNAWNIVYQELENEPLFRDVLSPDRLTVVVDAPYGEPDCPGQDSWRTSKAVDRAERAQFFVYSRLKIPPLIDIPFVGRPEDMILTETHWHYLECGPSLLPTPVP
ncbi:MAG: TadE/TadG family type IV pilus assembly protein [Anaerolineae bacterium]